MPSEVVNNFVDDPALTDSESNSSERSHTTARQRSEIQYVHSLSSSSATNMSGEESSSVFGNSLQRYGQQLTNALSKFKVTADLEDGNYPTWSRSIFDNLETLELHHYVKVDGFEDKELTEDKVIKTRKVIVSYILNRLDKSNHSQAVNRLTNPSDPNSILYNPHSLWMFLKDRHYLINAQRLASVTKTLSTITIARGDSIPGYLDKFENLFIEFTRYGGKMDDTQSAIQLIDSIDRLTESTVEFIHSTISPLTRREVSKYLREYDMRHNFVTEATREARNVEQSANTVSRGRRIECTETVCKGPHPADRCWSKPVNFPERDDFLARRRANRTGWSQKTSSTSAVRGSHPPVRGMKRLTNPTASANSVTQSEEMMSLHTSFEIVGTSPSANASTSSSSGVVWALHDTGATNHMFNSRAMFVADTLKPVDDPNRRVKLAGGEATLAVEGIGKVRLKAGDGTVFELTECLLVPELSRNLIAGGVLKKKGVREMFDTEDPSCFALVKNGLALFNGVILHNGLMNLAIESVSPLASPSSMQVKTPTYACSSILHRRLGHVSETYLNQMMKHGSLDGVITKSEDVDGCDICPIAKNTKLPFNHTRPRASQFLENVHTDISGINRVKGLGNESYYILFCNDYLSYRHIYGLTERSKTEVYEVFKNYIALVERQTGCRVKQFTLDRGGEFLNSLLAPDLESMGINLHLTAGHTPEQNGVSERGNRTIITKARCMMLESGAPKSFWFRACVMAVFLTNRSITKAVTNYRTPFEVWFF